MDILDILLDILLKPPQPLLGLFSYKEFFLCNVPLSQQVRGTHAKIVVMMQLDTSINS